MSHEAPHSLRPRHRGWLVSALGALAIATLLAAALALSSCASPLTHATAASKPNCATILAHALASPDKPIAGSYACLGATVQQANPGISTDADIERVAQQPPVYNAYKYVGQSAAGAKTKYAYYLLTGDNSDGSRPVACYRFHLDSAGRVDDLGFIQAACPSPLP